MKGQRRETWAAWCVDSIKHGRPSAAAWTNPIRPTPVAPESHMARNSHRVVAEQLMCQSCSEATGNSWAWHIKSLCSHMPRRPVYRSVWICGLVVYSLKQSVWQPRFRSGYCCGLWIEEQLKDYNSVVSNLSWQSVLCIILWFSWRGRK